MGKPPSERERDRRRAARAGRSPAAQDAERQRRRRNRRNRIMAIGLLLGVGAMVVATVAGSLLSNSSNDATTPSTVTPPVDLTVPPAGEAITGETPCPAEDGSSPRVTSFEQPPPQCLDPDARYQAIVQTSEGELTILLDQETAPNTANNFAVLSRYHFYDGVPFSRIVPSALVLTGDATGEPEVGRGGPGYTIDDEIGEAGVIYPFGAVAMWNESPDQNGSQFFIATGEDAAGLPPAFPLFGLVTDGADTLNAIQTFGDPTTGNPSEEVVVESIEIVELPPAP